MEFLLLPLLSVCLLSCSGTTSAQKGSAVVRVREGSDAVLPCFISSKQNIEKEYFDWRKVDQKVKYVFECDQGKHDPRGQDEQFKGRVSHFPDQLQSGDASIRIRDTKLSDSGNYTCHFPRLQPKEELFYIELVVGCILKDRSEENIPGTCGEPLVTAPVIYTDKVLLQCVVRRVSPKPKVEWQDSSGKILPAEEPQVTEREGKYDIILNTTVTKTYKYHCVVTQEEICHQISQETSVYIHDSSAGLAADVVVTFAITLFGVLAKCYITQN